MDLKSAYQHCLEITGNHYENFPVASMLIPTYYRKHIAAIYAFARTADDYSDVEGNRQKILDWRQQLLSCTTIPPDHLIFLALANTIRIFHIPVQLLDDLLTAFLMDLDVTRHQSLADLHAYCRFSANPVGRIILWIFNYRSESLLQYSDHITTALQLTNFWQDISIDLKKDRIYIPRYSLKKFGLTEEDLFQQKNTDNFSLMMDQLIGYTRTLFQKGMPLLNEVHGRLKWELRLTIAGGVTTLARVERHKSRLLSTRPVLNKWDWTVLVARIMTG